MPQIMTFLCVTKNGWFIPCTYLTFIHKRRYKNKIIWRSRLYLKYSILNLLTFYPFVPAWQLGKTKVFRVALNTRYQSVVQWNGSSLFQFFLQKIINQSVVHLGSKSGVNLSPNIPTYLQFVELSWLISILSMFYLDNHAVWCGVGEKWLV